MDLQLFRHVLKIAGNIPSRYAGFLHNKSINLINQRHAVFLLSDLNPFTRGMGWGYWGS